MVTERGVGGGVVVKRGELSAAVSKMCFGPVQCVCFSLQGGAPRCLYFCHTMTEGGEGERDIETEPQRERARS